MNVSLTPELVKFVEKEVESGLYQTASEVVRAGLRRLKEDQAARLPQAPWTLEELEGQLVSIDRLEPVINFLGEKDVQSNYIPAIRLGCRRSESLIRVM